MTTKRSAYEYAEKVILPRRETTVRKSFVRTYPPREFRPAPFDRNFHAEFDLERNPTTVRRPHRLDLASIEDREQRSNTEARWARLS